MFSYWKALLALSLLLASSGVQAETDDFILEKDGIIRIECADGTSPGAACKANGEIANFFTDDGTTFITHGNGVCLSCPTNQPADTVACETTNQCTCVKCADLDCEEPTEDCAKLGQQDASSSGSTSTLVAAGVLVGAMLL